MNECADNSCNSYYNVNTEVSDEDPGWKRLDTLIRRWTIKRLHEEQQLELFRSTMGM